MPRKTTKPTYYRDRECPTCHCFFTPQGLAGHLRFAHKHRYGERGIGDIVLEVQKTKLRVKALCSAAGFDAQHTNRLLRWLDDWGQLQLDGDLLGVRFTQQDFRHYLVARMGQER